MELHNNENSLHYDATQHTSEFDSILLEPPTIVPPVQASKPSSSNQIPGFESVNLSVTSDASEFDHAIFNYEFQTGETRNHSPSFKHNKMSAAPTFPCFNEKLTPSVRPKIKHVGEIHGPGLSTFSKIAETSFNSHMNGIPPKSRRQNLVSPKAYQLSGHKSKNLVLDSNGEFRAEFNEYGINSSFPSGNQNVCGESSHFESAKTSTVPLGVVKSNLLNKSDPVTLIPQQLQFHESDDAMNDYLFTNVSNSGYILENNSRPLHSTQMPKKFRKHHSLDDTENMPVHTKQQQESHPMDFINTNAKVSVPNDIWALFREQNEKIQQLQYQLLAIQQQNNSVAVSKKETTLELSEDKKFEMINKNLNNILEYITEHNNTILTLRDQVSVLAKRTEELESKSRNNISEPLDFSNAGAALSAKASNRHNSKDDVMCQNETVKKTSSSTMTSITLDGNEKLMFCKTTVVTENSKRDLLLQRSQNENPPSDNTRLNKARNSSGEVALNLCSNCTTPKSLKSKKASKGTGKRNRNCNDVTPKGDCNSHGTPTVRLRTSNQKNSSPQCNSNRENTDANFGQSSGENISPNFERILRNIENLALGKNEDEKTSSKHCNSCCCSEISSSPGTCAAAKGKSKSLKNLLVSEQFSTSEDSDNASPDSGWTEDDAFTDEWYDTTKKKFGIPPYLLSVDTQQYLEKHHLYENIDKRSSKKSKAPHLKRHIR